MTRAVELAIKKYPRFAERRVGFIDGYDQAKKDTIEKAVEWLEANANKYIVDLTPTYPEAPQELVIGGKCWEDFKEAMEKEEVE